MQIDFHNIKSGTMVFKCCWPDTRITKVTFLQAVDGDIKYMSDTGSKQFCSVKRAAFFLKEKYARKYLISKLNLNNSVLKDKINENNKIIKSLK